MPLYRLLVNAMKNPETPSPRIFLTLAALSRSVFLFKLQHGLWSGQKPEDPERRAELGKDGGDGGAGHAKMKDKDKERVQNDV